MAVGVFALAVLLAGLGAARAQGEQRAQCSAGRHGAGCGN